MSKDTKTKSLPLPSGKVAMIRAGKGRDVILAGRVVNAGKEPMAFAMALMAQLTTIDGKPIVMEDLEEMDIEDVMVLLEEVPGNSLTPGKYSA